MFPWCHSASFRNGKPSQSSRKGRRLIWLPIKKWSKIPKCHLGPIVFLVYFPECSAGPLKTRKLVEMGRQGRPPHSPLGNGVLALAQRLLGEVVVKKLSRHRRWIRGEARVRRAVASPPLTRLASCLLIRWTAVSK